MSCPGCGLAGLPFDASCSYCGRALRTPEEALARRREWDRLTDASKDAFQADAVRDRERFDRWLAWLRAARRRHAIAGALLLALPVAVVTTMIAQGTRLGSLAALSGDALLGAGAALLLNRLRGGEYRGMLLFTAAYGLSTLGKIALGWLLTPAQAGGYASGFVALLIISGGLLMMVLGYAFGLQLTLERSDA